MLGSGRRRRGAFDDVRAAQRRGSGVPRRDGKGSTLSAVNFARLSVDVMCLKSDASTQVSSPQPKPRRGHLRQCELRRQLLRSENSGASTCASANSGASTSASANPGVGTPRQRELTRERLPQGEPRREHLRQPEGGADMTAAPTIDLPLQQCAPNHRDHRCHCQPESGPDTPRLFDDPGSKSFQRNRSPALRHKTLQQPYA